MAMKKWFALSLALGCALVPAACSNPGGDSKPKAKERVTATVMQRPEVPPDADNSLSGTVWRFEEFTVSFKDQPDMHVKGGPIDDVDLEGVDGFYTLKDGRIEVSALEQTKVGLWDGEKLVIDGITGEKL